MLGKILKKSSCAECRVCCGFDSSDIWEMPVMNEETAKRIKEIKADTEFEAAQKGFVVKTPRLKENEIYYCPALTESGCALGDEKPFDCRIWPYRVMNFCGKTVITISPVCKELFSHPLAELTEFIDDEIGNFIFDYAEKHPETIKDYDYSYPILKVRP